jgi:regulator of replication initiation timing
MTMKTLTFIHTPEGLKAFTDDRSSALIVENPEVILYTDYKGLIWVRHKVNTDPLQIGDEFPCPSNVEWEVVDEIETNEGWKNVNCFYGLDRRRGQYRQVIRLSVKQEEKPKHIVNELYADNGELCGYSLINPKTGETICSEEDKELIDSLRSQLEEKDKELQIRISGAIKEVESLRSEIERLKNLNTEITREAENDGTNWYDLGYQHGAVAMVNDELVQENTRLQAENQQLKEELEREKSRNIPASAFKSPPQTN